jgi:hypothetical protein
MNTNIINLLSQAKTENEKHSLLLELSLTALSSELQKCVKALAVPHWFDANILAAVCPEYREQAEIFYQQLQALSFVEIFPDRGHNIHELTRNLLLKKLWEDDHAQYVMFSQQLADFFCGR